MTQISTKLIRTADYEKTGMSRTGYLCMKIAFNSICAVLFLCKRKISRCGKMLVCYLCIGSEECGWGNTGSNWVPCRYGYHELQHQPFQWIFRIDFLKDWLVCSPCNPRDSQGASLMPQFKSINSSTLNLLYSGSGVLPYFPAGLMVI